MDALSLRYDPDNLDGSSLNYVGEVRQRIWPLFLCVSVVGSEHSGSPQKARRHRVFPIYVHPYHIARSHLTCRVAKDEAGSPRLFLENKIKMSIDLAFYLPRMAPVLRPMSV